MQRWANRLRDDVGVEPPASDSLASTIFREVSELGADARKEVLAEERVSIRARIEELQAFQLWMDRAQQLQGPEIVRAQVIVQNYICFVYLGESCFKLLAKRAGPGSATRVCCRFLTDNPVRAFRNAIAHANWSYKPDFTGLEYWAKKGSGPDEPLCRFEVVQSELDFWQALARSVAYASFIALENGTP